MGAGLLIKDYKSNPFMRIVLIKILSFLFLLFIIKKLQMRHVVIGVSM